jgi:hypothetical protein
MLPHAVNTMVHMRGVLNAYATTKPRALRTPVPRKVFIKTLDHVPECSNDQHCPLRPVTRTENSVLGAGMRRQTYIWCLDASPVKTQGPALQPIVQ